MVPLIKYSLRIFLLSGGLLLSIVSKAQFKGGVNDGNSSVGITGCSVPVNIVKGGSYDGVSSALISNCTVPINIVAGGFFDGVSSVTGGGCAAPSNVVAGGSYDGASSVISSNCASPVNIVAGGSRDGASSVTGGGCAAPSNVVAGGSFDGSSSVVGGGCAAASNVVAGGSFDGASSVIGGGCAAFSNVVAGGTFDGASSVRGGGCAAPSNVVAGGSFDGASSVIGGGCAAAINVVAGGSFDGTASGIISSCGSFVNVVLGGSFDGVSSVSINNCATAINVVKGGSYDGSMAYLDTCGALNIVIVNFTNPTCNLCNGSVSVSASGGISPYTYLWSSGSTSTTATGLCAGNYVVTVTDAVSRKASTTITVTQAAQLSTTTSSISATCGNSNGSASVSATSGTTPYTYNWSSGTTSTTATGLAQGTYSVTVTDAGGCTKTNSVAVNNIAAPSVNIASQSNVSCNGGNNGTATASISGGTGPYSYAWSTSPLQTTLTANNLSTGNYSITVTDANGCTQTASVIITAPSVIVPSVFSQTDVNCFGGSNGSAIVSASGGTGAYVYLWSTSPVQTTSIAGGLSAGTFSVTVTDANGCSMTSSAIIAQPSVLSVTAGNDSPVCLGNNVNLSSLVSGGTVSYIYSWVGPNSFNSTDSNPVVTSATTADAGTYSLTVTDAQGCMASTFTTVTVNICTTTLNLNLFIEGYYLGSGQMQPVVLNEYVPNATGAETDTVYVELHDQTMPVNVVETSTAVLMTDGTATAVFSGTVTGGTYWIAIKHRNAVQTWSSSAVLMNATTNYDFRLSSSQAYGNNMIQVDYNPDLWALFNADINQDQNVDLLDFPDMDYGINNGLYGYYNTDLNGDGNVDLLDFPILDSNINNGIYSFHP